MANWCIDEDFYFVSEADILKDLQSYIEENGVKGIDRKLQQQMHAWKDVKVNIGVVGECMTGKSTFINRIRGLNDTDEGAALVGTGDVTEEPTPYSHPRNESLIFWDLPGVGTARFPRNKSFLKNIHFDRYDFFLIFSDGSFSENDSWLARQITGTNKWFFFVRTKVDNDMENVMYDEGDVSEEEILNRIRQDCERNFKMTGLTNVKLFIVSHFEIHKWEFESLLDTICLSLPEMKRNMMMISLGPLSQDIIKQKRKTLEKRAYTISLISGLAGACPIPALDILVDVAILVEEVNHYLKTFGLDEESLQHLAHRTGKPFEYYISTLSAGKMILSVRTYVIDFLVSHAAEQAAETAAKNFAKYLPIIGQLISGTVSYSTTVYLLINTIKELEKDAICVFKEVIKCTSCP